MAAREIVIVCGPGGVGKTTVAAAVAAMAACRQRRQGPGPHRRPRPPAGQRPGSVGRPRRAPNRCRSAPSPSRHRAARRIMDGDVGHQVELGPPGEPARARHGHGPADPGQPPLPEHFRPVRAKPRLHSRGTIIRDPFTRCLRPYRRRHAADPQRHRLSPGPRAHGRVFQFPVAAPAHRPVPEPVGRYGVPSRSTMSPTGSWVRSSSRTSQSSSYSSKHCRRVLWPGPRRSSGSWPTAAPRL